MVKRFPRHVILTAAKHVRTPEFVASDGTHAVEDIVHIDSQDHVMACGCVVRNGEYVWVCPKHRWHDTSVDDNLDRDGGPLEDADEDAMSRWADAYDDLNGAPENDEDR